MAKKSDEMKDVWREYSKLRSIARKRLERMSQSEFKDTQTYRYFKDRIPTVKEMENWSKSSIVMKLNEIRSFVGSRRSSIRGMKAIRKESLETLHTNGYDFVNKSNWSDWVAFMEKWHDDHPRLPGSPTREEMRTYLDNVKNGMTQEEAYAEFQKYEDSKV